MVPNVVLKRIQINEELVKTNYEFLVPNIHHELIYNCWTISDKTEDSESREGRFSNHSRLRLPSHLLWIERRAVGTEAPPLPDICRNKSKTFTSKMPWVTKAELPQESIFFLIHLFARDIS